VIEDGEIQHEHRDVTGGWLRPAVFGVMDGLVSNVALIAGLVGGAFSMATGEYTSVAAQSELTRAEIAVERAEIRAQPAAEERELAGLYRSRGVDPHLADQVAAQLSRDPEQAWRVHAREELGVDPDDLPSPWVAAGSSFAAFTVGAFLPLLPYLLGASSLLATAVLAAVGLFGFGALTARFTQRGWVYSGLRQLLLGTAAAAVTFGVGAAVGAGLG
jgi:VIT1/CCC1 family predicted Fe2+/Mn2+ transporter